VEVLAGVSAGDGWGISLIFAGVLTLLRWVVLRRIVQEVDEDPGSSEEIRQAVEDLDRTPRLQRTRWQVFRVGAQADPRRAHRIARLALGLGTGLVVAGALLTAVL
jgi:hypothetical protein